MLTTVKHLSISEMEAQLDDLRNSPKKEGKIELIVRRPAIGQREVLQTGELDTTQGLIGDNWSTRGSSRTPDGTAHPEMQINIMNARVIKLIATEKQYWPLAGDQFYVELDFITENLPPGTRLGLGSAILEVTSIPHNGCKKFAERFGLDAVKFVNSPVGKELHFRGINAKVVKSGIVNSGDMIRRLETVS